MLTVEQKKHITQIYDNTCKAFDKILDPDVLRMQIEDISDLDYGSIVNAISVYRRDGKNVTWPRASKIREIINPKQSKESMSNEAASRIREAITKFGWCNIEQAKTFVGELGWAVVQRSGGWQYVCENHGLELNPTTFHAQSRDLAKSMAESAELGIFNQPIGIPERKSIFDSNDLMKVISLKEIPKK